MHNLTIVGETRGDRMDDIAHVRPSWNRRVLGHFLRHNQSLGVPHAVVLGQIPPVDAGSPYISLNPKSPLDGRGQGDYANYRGFLTFCDLYTHRAANCCGVYILQKTSWPDLKADVRNMSVKRSRQQVQKDRTCRFRVNKN